MVNRKMRPAQALSLIRKLARQHRMTIEQLPGRGKGSHQIWMLVESDGREVARFGLTDHPQDLSWTILRRLEEHLAPTFGTKWMEK
jgi:hypothetical protein